MSQTHFKIVIVGAGPAGISAAARAAELGVEHLLLEGSGYIANTIYRFQKGKAVMAEPAAQPVRSAVSFGAGEREQLLQTWNDELLGHQVNTRLGASVAAISGEKGNFIVILSTGQSFTAEFVVLAIGLQGNIRKLGVSGDDLPCVQYQLDDPDEYQNETVVVVGAGDAAVENALALTSRNRVILVNRQGEFSNCKEANHALLMQAVSTEVIETRVSTVTERIETSPEPDFPLVYVAQTPQGQEHIFCHRVIARLGATPPRRLVESFGVVFPNAELTSVPQLSEQYESNVPGLYVVGSLAGYPLIKQALNQGFEVIEYIMGRPVEPADEPLLRQKFVGLTHIQSVGEGIALLRNTLPLLSPLTTLQLREFVQDSSILTLHDGQVVFQQNDYSNTFFSILSGAVRVQVEDDEGQTSVSRLSVGDFFGEIELISGRRRSATVVALQDCVLIETPRRYMIKLLGSASGVQRKLDEVALKRVLAQCLNESLTEVELDYLVEDAKFKRYCVGDILFHEGDQADGLYMIRSGSVTVSRVIEGREVVMSYVSAGNYVGEMALVSNKPRSATVRAASPTEVVLLEAQRVGALMAKNPDIRNKVDSRYLENLRDAQYLPPSEASSLIKFLMEQGVGEATDVLLIDYSRCIRCNNCEAACADLHDGTSRLDRHAGPTYAQIHVPASCRHCEHPHCMKDCPPDAIHRSVNGEVYIGSSCIGCGNCQKNCPYGVIQMEVKKNYTQRSLWQTFFGVPRAAKVQSNLEKKGHNKAVKCDMCKDIIAGPACVRACPTGAAMRVSPEDFFGLIR